MTRSLLYFMYLCSYVPVFIVKWCFSSQFGRKEFDRYLEYLCGVRYIQVWWKIGSFICHSKRGVDNVFFCLHVFGERNESHFINVQWMFQKRSAKKTGCIINVLVTVVSERWNLIGTCSAEMQRLFLLQVAESTIFSSSGQMQRWAKEWDHYQEGK